MNKRVQALAEQAGLFVDHNGKPWPKALSADESVAAYNMFAEFIVMECVNVLDQQGLWNIEMSNILAKHFGVGYGHNSN